MSEYIKNKETGKIELHFDKAEYMALSQEDKKMIKSAFLFSRYSGAWISRGKYPSGSYARTEQIAKKLGFEDGGTVGETLSFAEQMEVKAEKAERRAERYEYKSNEAQKTGEQLQSGINKMHGDIAFFTQPNINSSAGRAFTKQRNKMWDKWERGFEEFKKSEYYARRAEVARNTASNTKPNDKAFCERRIKEAEKSIKKLRNSIEEYCTIIEQLEKGETPKNKYGYEVNISIEKCQEEIERLSELLDMEISKATYYYDCIEELGGINFSKDNIKKGYIVKVSRWNRLFNVEVYGTGKVNFTSKGDGKFSYSEIVEIVKAEEKTEIEHPFKVGEEYTVDVYDYEQHKYVPKTYKVIKVTVDKVTLKSGDERAISKKVRYFEYGKNNKGYAIGITDGRNGTIYKNLTESESEVG